MAHRPTFVPWLVLMTIIGTGCQDEPVETRPRSDAVSPPPPGGMPVTPSRPSLPVLDEWSIRIPEEDRVLPAGPTTFLIVNQGVFTHGFVIEGQDRRWGEVARIPPGGEAQLTVDLPPGTYTVYCPIEDEHGNHAEQGMRTPLTVE